MKFSTHYPFQYNASLLKLNQMNNLSEKKLGFLFFCCLLLSQLMQPLYAQAVLPCGELTLQYQQHPTDEEAAKQYDYTIPSNVDQIKFTIRGGAGGYAEIDCITDLFKAGGGGATITNLTFPVGPNVNDVDTDRLESGGKLKMIVGEHGENESQFCAGNAQGGGGGSSGVAYQPPGESDWYILAVAGAGGGAILATDQQVGKGADESQAGGDSQNCTGCGAGGEHGHAGERGSGLGNYVDGFPGGGVFSRWGNFAGSGASTLSDVTNGPLIDEYSSYRWIKGRIHNDAGEGGVCTQLACLDYSKGGAGFTGGGASLASSGGGGGYSGGAPGSTSDDPGAGGGSWYSLYFGVHAIVVPSITPGIDGGGGGNGVIIIETITTSPNQPISCKTSYTKTITPATYEYIKPSDLLLSYPFSEGCSGPVHLAINETNPWTPGQDLAFETPSNSTDTWRVGCYDEAGPIPGGGVGFTTHGVGQYPVYVRAAYSSSGDNVCQTTVYVTGAANQSFCKNKTVYLDANGSYNLTGSDVFKSGVDDCGSINGVFDSMNQSLVGCDDIGSPVSVTVTIKDPMNGDAIKGTCTSMITVEENLGFVPNCANITVVLDYTGTATIIPEDHLGNSMMDICGNLGSVSTMDYITVDCDLVGAGPTVNTITGLDDEGNSWSCSPTITVVDNTPPTPPGGSCKTTFSVMLDENGQRTIASGQFQNNAFYDNCAEFVGDLNHSFSINNIQITEFDCSHLGTQEVVMSVTDNSGNTNSTYCTTQITVLDYDGSDNVDPVIFCKNTTIQLDASGNYTIQAGDVFDGGTDNNCNAVVSFVAANPSTLSCADMNGSPVQVTVTGTDGHGNNSNCIANVTIQTDNMPPVAMCKSVIVNVDAEGNFTPEASIFDDGSHVACEPGNNVGLTYTFSPAVFTCADVSVASQNYTMTVTTLGGQSSSCQNTIKINDNISPTAICQNASVQLGTDGTATLLAETLDGGSFDNCDVVFELSDQLSPWTSTYSFDCSDIGTKFFVFRVRELNLPNASSNCTAEVTIIDDIAPTVTCQNHTVSLDGNGNATINEADVVTSKADNCGAPDISFSQSTFTSGGSFNITVTATDGSGNSSNCASTVAVTFVDAIYHVKTTGSDTNDGLSWGNAFATVEHALSVAISSNEIWVAEGTYYTTTGTDRSVSFIMKNGVEIYGGFPNTGSPGMAERDWNTHVTTLSGDIGTPGDHSDNSYHVIFNNNNGLDASAILDGFTVSGGNANGIFPHNNGGGMYNFGSSPMISNAIFSENLAVYGGGVYNFSSLVTISNTIFSNNSATGDGGGMYNLDSPLTIESAEFSENTATNGGGMFNNFSSPIISNTIFSDNSATDNGGGVYNDNVSSLTISGTTFSENTATYGGGIFNSSSSPTISGTTFSGNSALYFGGGMASYNSSPTISDVIFSENSAGQGAGGMYNNTSSPVISGTTFSENTAGVGGGMYNSSSSFPTISGTTFLGNIATDDGGGMNNYNSSPTISGTIFSGNIATNEGGGMYNFDSSPMIDNTEFSENTATNGGGMFNDYDCSPTISNATFSNNSAYYGGGMYNDNDSSPTISGTTFSENTATYYGGGMYNNESLPTISQTAFSGNFAEYDGGGMYNNESSPTIDQTTFSGNSAEYNGGGVYNNFYSSPTISDVVFSGNSAADGGGMNNNYYCSPVISQTTFSGNSATNDGGGMYNNYNSSPTISQAIFSDNSATDNGGGMNNYSSSPTISQTAFSGNSAEDDGGGMYNDNASSPMIDNTKFSENTATFGGGVYNDFNSSPTISQTTFSSNSATIGGGGVYNDFNSSTTISQTTFSNNTAYVGGGMANANSSLLTISNAIFSSNSAVFGGGMYNSSSSLTISQATFFNNSAADGSGMYNYSSSLAITNSILWDDVNTSEIYNNNSSLTITYSIVKGGYAGVGNKNEDPLFIDPNNGDLHIPSCSPAVDAGTDTGASATDFDDNPRYDAIAGGAVTDMGAFEFQAGGSNEGCNEPPVAECKNITVDATDGCMGIAVAADFDNGSSDPDEDMITFSVNPVGPYPLGETTVTFTVSDGEETSECTATITVKDMTPPVPNCKTTTVALGSDGNYTLTENDVFDGGTDNCGTVNFVSMLPATVSCNDINAPVSVMVRTNDDNGNVATCNATITVKDMTPPVPNCKTTTVALSSDGNYTLTENDVFDGGTDNCGTVNFVSMLPATVSCNDINAPVSVTVTADDGNGNTATCVAYITIEDNDNPQWVSGCPDNFEIYTDQFTCLALVEQEAPEANDACLNVVKHRVRMVDPVTLANMGPWQGGWTTGDLSMELPIGTYKVRWRAEDLSGNRKHCNQFVTVKEVLPCPYVQLEDGVGCEGGNGAWYDVETETFWLESENCSNPISSTADEYAFIQRELCGNGSITVKVTSLESSDASNGWAGIMMRESNDPLAPSVNLATNKSSNHRKNVRTSYGANITSQMSPAFNRHWLRIVRNGNSFRGYTSSNGTSWVLKFSHTVVMESCIEVGMTLTSYTSAGDHTASFEQVTFEGNVSSLQENGSQDELQVNNIERELIAYPSPTSGPTTVSLNGYIDQKGTLDVVNAFGQVLMTRQLGLIESSKHDLDLSSLPSGVYTIRLHLETGKVEMIQIVKQ